MKSIQYMLISTLFFAAMNIGIKYVPNIPAAEIVFFRSIVTLALTFYLIKRAGLSIKGNNKKFLILRGLFGMLGLFFYFETVQNIPLASAVTIQYLSPIFSTFFAIFLLGQRVHPMRWLFFAIALAGVFMIKGFDDRISTVMFATGILSAIFSGLAYNMISKLRKFDHPLVIIFYFPLVTIPIITPYMITVWKTPTVEEFLILLGIGLATQFAQYFLTMALVVGRMANVTIVKYIGVVYALLIGYFLFGEEFNTASILGMFTVVGGIMLSVIYAYRTNKKATSR